MIAEILGGSLISGSGILADGHGGGNRGYDGDDRMHESSSEMFYRGIYHQNMEYRKVKRLVPKEFPWTKSKKFNQKFWFSKWTAISLNSAGNKVLTELHFQF